MKKPLSMEIEGIPDLSIIQSDVALESALTWRDGRHGDRRTRALIVGMTAGIESDRPLYNDGAPFHRRRFARRAADNNSFGMSGFSSAGGNSSCRLAMRSVR